MRLLAAALAATVFATPATTLAQADVTQAAAEGDWLPNFTTRSTEEDLMAAYPPRALEDKQSGWVELVCVAGEDGRLLQCKVDKEAPEGQGFGEAALKVVQQERIRTRDRDGKSVIGRRLSAYYTFTAPGEAKVEWLSKPDGEVMASAYPAAAMKNGINGRAVLSCGVTVEGFLSNCKVAGEKPTDMGFGAAALLVAPHFRMTPRMKAGQPVASSIMLPIIWMGMETFREYPAEAGRSVLKDPPWLKTPTAQDVRAAWPPKARATAAIATVRCRLQEEGYLRGCRAISESPKGQGFGAAAVKLTKGFQVRLSAGEAKSAPSYLIDIPFRFREPTAPDTRKIVGPKWVRSLTPLSAAKVFPSGAREAGVYNGLGVINCLVGADGGLSDCKVVKEDPTGLGFGDSAIQAAHYMAMNPWSADGDPVDGLRVTLPVRLVVDPPTPGAESKPPAL